MKNISEFTPDFFKNLVQTDVQRALEEDVGEGDLTAALVPSDQMASAHIVAREAAVVCGQPWVNAALRVLDPFVQPSWHVQEGQHCTAGQVVLTIQGRAQAMLSAERTVLNFLQLLSGVATKTATFVAAVEGTRTAIVDTRKTLPGLRLAQKYAVKTGGGVNHRMGLYDAILIKENHIAAAGGIAQVLAQVKVSSPLANFVQIEVETLPQLDEALACGASMLLLDNMDLPTLHEAVRRNAQRAVLEISGGVSLQTVRELAQTGVDRISIGALTKDVRAVDYSMRLDEV